MFGSFANHYFLLVWIKRFIFYVQIKRMHTWCVMIQILKQNMESHFMWRVIVRTRLKVFLFRYSPVYILFEIFSPICYTVQLNYLTIKLNKRIFVITQYQIFIFPRFVLVLKQFDLTSHTSPLLELNILEIRG